MNLYNNLTKFSGMASGYAAKSQMEQDRRRYSDKLFEIKSQNRSRLFGMIGQVLNIGGGLYQNYSENLEIADYAREKGIDVGGNIFNMAFGSPSFRYEGEDVGRDFVMGMREYDKYLKTRNMLDELFSGQEEAVTSKTVDDRSLYRFTEGLEEAY